MVCTPGCTGADAAGAHVGAAKAVPAAIRLAHATTAQKAMSLRIRYLPRKRSKRSIERQRRSPTELAVANVPRPMSVPLFDTHTPVAPLLSAIQAKLHDVIEGSRFILGPEVEAF